MEMQSLRSDPKPLADLLRRGDGCLGRLATQL